jgi:polyisoprenoid-binding protein YceI
MSTNRMRMIAMGGLALGIVASCTTTERAESAVKDTSTTVMAPSNGNGDATATAETRYIVTATGNAARYRIREQLLGVDFPNDAVGETARITGEIVFDDTGRIVPASSRFVIDAGSFVSDKDRRDGYVRSRLLVADEHPSVVFVPREVRGLTAPVTAGTHSFQLVGDLTVRGVTRPTTWNVTATVTGSTVTGNARTQFTFADFSMEKPRVRSVLSVEDTIALEYDFTVQAPLSSNGRRGA